MTWPHRLAVSFAIALAAGAVTLAQTGTVAPARTLADGVFTTEQAGRGRLAYTTHCAECHMSDLSGREYAGALAGYGFQLKWQDATLAELLGRLRSMPLGRPGSLTSQEYLDVLAYILQKNAYPDGPAEVTTAVVSTWPPIRIVRTLVP